MQEQATRLALIFDDPVALQTLHAAAVDRRTPAERRVRAIEALVGRRVGGLDAVLLTLLDDASVRRAAIQGLAEYQHPATAETLLRIYPSLAPDERQDAVQTLASRQAWAVALLDAVAGNVVPRSEITAFTARQLRSFNNAALTRRLGDLWGEVRESPAERQRQITDWRRRLTSASLAAADPAAGRVLYRKLCANCHRLFDDGGEIGPNITGSQRHNLDYLLENILDPSASVSRDFQMEILQTDSGRVITGLVVAETETALTVATVNERIVVPRVEIEERQTSPLSLMPEGLFNGLTPADVRNLVRYLSNDRQVPLPETALP